MQIKSQADLLNKRLSIQSVSGIAGEEVRIWFWSEKGLCQWNGLDLITAGETVGGAFRRMAELIDSMPAKTTPITPEEYDAKMRSILKGNKHDPPFAALDLMERTLASLGYVYVEKPK